jgi:hypothetical protein
VELLVGVLGQLAILDHVLDVTVHGMREGTIVFRGQSIVMNLFQLRGDVRADARHARKHVLIALPLVAVIERQFHGAAAVVAVIVFLGESLRGQAKSEARREEGGKQSGPSEHCVYLPCVWTLCWLADCFANLKRRLKGVDVDTRQLGVSAMCGGACKDRLGPQQIRLMVKQISRDRF